MEATKVSNHLYLVVVGDSSYKVRATTASGITKLDCQCSIYKKMGDCKHREFIVSTMEGNFSVPKKRKMVSQEWIGDVRVSIAKTVKSLSF